MSDRLSVTQVRMQQWYSIIRSQKESGLTVDAFCEANNISKNRYFYWQKKLRETAIEIAGGFTISLTRVVYHLS